MFQIPVQNLDKIRKARKKVKGILVDIGLDSCRELLQAINSYDPGEKYFYNTSWGDVSPWDSSGRKRRYRTKPYCCSLCNFSTKLPSSFKNHLHRYHEDEVDQELMVACPSCAFASQSKTVVKHMRMFHTSVRKIQHYAVNSFGGTSQSRKDTVKFSCLKCSFTDPLYYSMKRHVLMTHFENLISAYFGERSDNTAFQNRNETLFTNELKSPPSHKYYCKKCNAFANTQDALVYHILTSEKHRDLEYELRSAISEFSKTHSRKTAPLKPSNIAPKTPVNNHPGLAPPSATAVSMPSPPLMNMFSIPHNSQHLAIAKQSQAALQNNARAMPVTSNASGNIMQTSSSVATPPHLGFVPSTLPTSQNITLQTSLSQSVFVSHRFPITQPVGPGVLPPNQSVQPGLFPPPQPGALSFNQPVQAGVLPLNHTLSAGGFSLNHPMRPGALGVSQPMAPGALGVSQPMAPGALGVSQPMAPGALGVSQPMAPGALGVSQPMAPGALGVSQPMAPGVFSVNQSVRPGIFSANHAGLSQNPFMTAAPLLRQLIPTGKQVNGIPTYTLAPVSVTLPVPPGGVANVTAPQVPIQLTQSNTVAQISHSPASAPSPPVMTSPRNVLDQASRRAPSTNIPGKQAKQWKTCPVCNELFPSNVYQVHMEVAHKQQGVLKANEQDPQKTRETAEPEKLAARTPFLRWIREKAVRCLSCKCFLTESDLIKHVMMHGLACLFCTGTFHDLVSFVAHNKTMHSEKKKLHVDYIKKGFELTNDASGNILFPHFDFNTALPKEEVGEKEINLVVLAGANSRTFVPVYIKVQHQITESNQCIKQALKCPFCLCTFAGSEVYETHLKDRHHIMPTVHTILKTPAFKCIHCCGVYTGNMTLTAIAVHLLRCRSAPKDSSSGVLAPLDKSGESGQPVNGEVHDSASLSNKRKSDSSSSGVPLAGDQTDKGQEQPSSYTSVFKMSGKELIPVSSKRKKVEAVAKPTGLSSGDDTDCILALDPKPYERGSHENRKHFLIDYFHKRPYPTKREVELLSSLMWVQKIDVAAFFGKKQNSCLRAIKTRKHCVLLGFKMSELKNVKHSLSV
ncbi:activity-dependent neuroprotector homeobox protein 2 [Rhinatrema bivittatum]|uniref:activity-dependent neuroprotector homeobox protein 2 n=1 Tax=Rhinatrema bivittatum TaxID=194408 RepID=UPI00112EE5F9|nr:activity-dependent neuroprotector homeobox protein 2 [Rhinatrema bivittatum]XP_029446660.1 activity-dependent neuroprotector homeobox protein 2 [Rhinatrema bivittatum]